MVKAPQDRRYNQRFPIHLPIHFRVSQKGVASRWNTGTTCDISSGGLSFRCRRPLPVGAHIEMLIDWPARTDDPDTVSLQSTGFIVRSDGIRTAVRMTARQFRADAAQSQAIGQTA
ncbi:MAG TPA: PilZ domain-containing protein [Candidatus Acidoferrales bacterium]|nr:PilZ domain-containing protein [Candidatus Acidoferrales bacterium]